MRGGGLLNVFGLPQSNGLRCRSWLASPLQHVVLLERVWQGEDEGDGDEDAARKRHLPGPALLQKLGNGGSSLAACPARARAAIPEAGHHIVAVAAAYVRAGQSTVLAEQCVAHAEEGRDEAADGERDPGAGGDLVIAVVVVAAAAVSIACRMRGVWRVCWRRGIWCVSAAAAAAAGALPTVAVSRVPAPSGAAAGTLRLGAAARASGRARVTIG